MDDHLVRTCLGSALVSLPYIVVTNTHRKHTEELFWPRASGNPRVVVLLNGQDSGQEGKIIKLQLSRDRTESLLYLLAAISSPFLFLSAG